MKSRIDFPDDGGRRLRLRFSRPVRVIEARTLAEVAGAVAEADRLARAGKWVTGFVAYEAAPAFDPAFRVRTPTGNLPLAAFAAYDRPDDEAGAHPGASASAPFSAGPWRMQTDAAGMGEGVERIRRAIAAGDYYQVNYTTHLRGRFNGDAGALFDALRLAQPDAYCVSLDQGAWQVLSVSPELFFDWRPDGHLVTRPMKGTAPRHADPGADAAAARELRASEKDRAENLMIVDLLRNDLARVAATGTVRVPGLFEVEALPTVWQMTSTVECVTRAGVGLEDVFAALFPCGSVTGAPKVAAMAAIADLETAPRGAYCGAIGVIRPGGHATFNVGIRTVAVDHAGGVAECGVGSGITLDSTASGEYAEWLMKRRFLLRACAGFELIETLRLEEGQYWLEGGHLARLRDSAEHFGFSCDREAVARALRDCAGRHPQGAWRVRLLLDSQGRAKTEAYTLDSLPADPVVALAGEAIDGSDEFLRHKTTERAIYQRHAPPAGFFDTLLWNARGEVTEFTRGNVVVDIGGRRLTPPVECGLLPGVLRAELLARGEIEEGVIRLEELAGARAVWFINSVRGMLAVRLSAPPA